MIVDVLIIVLLFMGTGYGLFVGGIKQIFSILGIVAGILMGVLFTKKIAIMLGYQNETLALIIIFLILFVLVFVITMFVGRMIRKIMHLMLMSMLDRLLGMAIGLIKGYVAAWIVTMLIFYFNPGILTKSKLGPVVLNISRFFIGEIFKSGKTI